MNESVIALLRETPVFAGLGEETLERLAPAATLVEVPPGTSLFGQGDEATWLHLLVRGMVALTASAPTNGEAVVVEVVAPKELFVLAATLLAAPYVVAARTLQAARLLLVDAVRLRQAAVEDSRLAMALMQEIGRQYRRMVDQVTDLKLRSASQRLARYLVALLDGQPAGGAEVHLPYDKRLLAARLGMQPEHLSRAFAALRRYGVVTYGLHVHIAEPDLLAAFAAVNGAMPTGASGTHADGARRNS